MHPLWERLGALLVYVNPFAGEMNKSRRMAALQARAFAAADHAVLQIDLLGCDDSPGDFSDATCAAWLNGVVGACAHARARHAGVWPQSAPPPLRLWGRRAGCLLAAETAARLDGPSYLLFWQPALQGKAVPHQFLRLHTASVLPGESAGQTAETRRQAFDAGQTVDAAGHGMCPALASGVEAARLLPAPHAGRLEWIEIATNADGSLFTVAASALPVWAQVGWIDRQHPVAGRRFWQTTDVEVAPELVAAALLALGLDEAASPSASATVMEPIALGQCRMSAHTEQTTTFDSQGSTLLGIVAAPAHGRVQADIGVLVVLGGPQYRAGSHRQFVQLARALDEAGHVALRFDVRGTGDSHGQPAGFEAVSDDIAAAIGPLQAQAPQARRAALFGLSDGASAASLYLYDPNDSRVAAICLLNPWVPTDQRFARTHVRHFYFKRLASGEFWRKLLAGDGGKLALADSAGALRRSRQAADSAPLAPMRRPNVHFRDAMRSVCAASTGPVLLAISGDDLTAKEFADSVAADSTWRQLILRGSTQTLPLPGADHTLSKPTAKRPFEEAMIRWLTAIESPPALATAVP